MWLLVIISGLSGYLLFNSKMNINKVIQNNDLSGIKSILSGIKTKLSDELREFIEEDYPFDLIDEIKNNFKYEKLEDYETFIDRSIEHYSKGNQQMKNRIKDLRNRIDDDTEETKKVYYLTKTLLEVKDPCWVKRKVVSHFCN